MGYRKKVKGICVGLAILSSVALFSGCIKESKPQQVVVPVKVMHVLKQDAPLLYEYSGQVKAQNEVKVNSSVSGNLVEKFVKGGDKVSVGQPLFRIDPRHFRSVLHSAQAQLAQSEVNLANIKRDTERYRELFKADAISEQALATQEALYEQQKAAVAHNIALVEDAQADMDNTIIYSTVDGRMDVNDIAIGTFVILGTTTIATVSSADPIYLEFSMSENEYIQLMKRYLKPVSEWNMQVSLQLSDGTVFPYKGYIEQVDSSIADTGALTFRATFSNPGGILIPGMFGRIVIDGEVSKDAIMVPQRAVLPLLEKNFVTVVVDNKAVTKEVVLGEKVGSYWIVKKGLDGTETVVVEGLTRIQDGIALAPTEVTAEEMKFTLK